MTEPGRPAASILEDASWEARRRKRAADYTTRLFHTSDDKTVRCRWCGQHWPCPPLRRAAAGLGKPQ